ncbi:phosphonate metabolism protein/1,5-bisphosphokinase (PRPP-forming) PhnN [Roseicyclus sp.]|uniref:phosphonate metabolism protein/1,5-bisphosphokinase (PRPP-forming) PhnN n=1 Tax=Roseicyclus sp. TaxID=1914329 RepID=UPI004053E844
MGGRFIAVVGPSGVGKDSVMAGLCDARPDLVRVRRVITRTPDAGGEDYEAVSPALFAARAAGGDFALHWQAHGLSFAIPRSTHDILDRGQDALANLSRAMLSRAAHVFGTLTVLHVTATPDVLAQRLAVRGREGRAEIARRLARPAPDFPQDLPIVEIDNSGQLDRAVAAALAALYPENR